MGVQSRGRGSGYLQEAGLFLLQWREVKDGSRYRLGPHVSWWEPGLEANSDSKPSVYKKSGREL